MTRRFVAAHPADLWCRACDADGGEPCKRTNSRGQPKPCADRCEQCGGPAVTGEWGPMLCDACAASTALGDGGAAA